MELSAWLIPLVMRYAVLPSVARQGGEGGRNSAIIIGYSVAGGGSIFALFAGIAEGRGWPAIPLGAIALYAWAFTWMYVRELPEAP